MASPDITVITPVWEGADFLARNIRSVLAQTHTNWEQIIVDDGSTDASFEIASTIAKGESRMRVLRLERNSGPSAARNAALNEARGNQIVYLDADDEYYAEFFETAVRLRGTADVLVFEYDLVCEDAGRAPIGTRWTANPVWGLRRLMQQNCFVPLAVAHERALFERVGGFNVNTVYEEDWDLWKRFHLAGATLTAVPHKSGLYHARGNSQARTKRKPDSLGT